MAVKLNTPSKSYTGDIFGVKFINGEAIVEDEKLGNYVAKRFGYKSEPVESDPDKEQTEDPEEVAGPDYDSMVKSELQSILKEKGIEYGKNDTNKQLIELIKAQ